MLSSFDFIHDVQIEGQKKEQRILTEFVLQSAVKKTLLTSLGMVSSWVLAGGLASKPELESNMIRKTLDFRNIIGCFCQELNKDIGTYPSKVCTLNIKLQPAR